MTPAADVAWKAQRQKVGRRLSNPMSGVYLSREPFFFCSPAQKRINDHQWPSKTTNTLCGARTPALRVGAPLTNEQGQDRPLGPVAGDSWHGSGSTRSKFLAWARLKEDRSMRGHKTGCWGMSASPISGDISITNSQSRFSLLTRRSRGSEAGRGAPCAQGSAGSRTGSLPRAAEQKRPTGDGLNNVSFSSGGIGPGGQKGQIGEANLAGLLPLEERTESP